MDGWMKEGWMAGWVDGRVARWVDGSIPPPPLIVLLLYEMKAASPVAMGTAHIAAHTADLRNRHSFL